MVRQIRSKFLLEIFDNKVGNLGALTKYLAVYSANISPENRTDTNELISFLEDPFDDRRLLYFGLKYDGVHCGFAIAMSYTKDKILIVDHLAVDPAVRGKGAFFEFVYLISDYLDSHGIAPDYVVVEIMKRTQSIQGDVKPSELVRLLRIIGFHVVQIPYIAPHFGIAERVENYRSVLMVFPRQPVTEVPAGECRRIIEMIYYVHYQNWYRRAWPAKKFATYRSSLDHCFKAVTGRLTNVAFVKLNGGVAPGDEPFIRGGPASHATDFTIAAFMIGPVIVTLAVALAQALWIAALALSATLIALFVVFTVPKWRLWLVRFFRPG
jgi:hypothetical protein